MDIKQLVDLGIDEPKAKEIYNKIEKHINNQVKLKTSQLEDHILDLELKIAIERQLFIAKAKNTKAVMALIDFNKLDKRNIDETLIKSMIEQLKNNDETRFLFEENQNDKITGFKPLEINRNIANKRQLSYEELCKYYEKGIF
nr:phage scaffolding protein [uncultured Tyzzerella sp.]